MAEGPDRLHAIDALWLEMEGDGPPIAIGTVAVCAGPVPGDDEVHRMLADRIERMPRLHQGLSDQGSGLRRPVWVEAQGWALADHVHHLDAAPSGAHPGLDAAVSHIMAQPLPVDRPLWDMWVVDGLDDGLADGLADGPDDGLDGGWALVWRVHHTVVDGVGALSLLGHGFDVAPSGGQSLAEAMLTAARGSPAQPPNPTTPDREPGLRSGLAAGLGHALGAVRDAAPHIVPAAAALVPHPPSPLAGRVGDDRRWVSADVPLADVKVVGRAFGATVNEVVLALVTAGFRDLLLARGEPVSGRVVRNLVPVSMRPPGDGSAHNKVSAMLGNLPVGVADPVERLQAARHEVEHGREAGTPLLGSFLLDLVDRTVPAGVQDVAVASAGRFAPAWFIDTLTTNVPGPQFPVYLCGRRVAAMYPLIPVAGHTCITTGIFSYDGTLNIGVTGDADQAGDVDILARGIARAADELVERVGARRA